MAKPKMPRVTEPDENMVHYAPDTLSSNVTLCGLMHFIGAQEPGESTDLSVTCNSCKSIKAWCDKHSA